MKYKNINSKKSNKSLIKNENATKSRFINMLTRFSLPILAIIILLTYFQTIGFDLVFCDDHEIIISHYDRIAELSRWDDELFKGYIDTNYYRPIVNLSFLFDAQISGQKAYFYHITNILLHILFVFALYFTLINLEYKKITALMTSSIFAVHPIVTNAVAWIAGRNDILFGLFCVLSLLFLIKHYNSKRVLYLLLHLLALMLAFLSKETAFIFPAVLFSYLVIIKKEKIASKINIRYIVYWLILILIAFSMRSVAELGKDINRMGFDVFLMNLQTLPEYVAKFFLPINQSGLPAFSILSTGIGIIFIILLTIIIKLKRNKRKNFIYLGIIWFLTMTLPTIFFTILNSNDWNEYLECRAYLPIIGLIIIVLEIIPKKWKNFESRIAFTITSGLIIIFAIATVLESMNYKNSITFYESVVEDNDDKALYHEMLSNIYHNAGKIDKAEYHIKKTIEANPNYAKYYSKIGKFYLENKDNSDSALKYYKKALEKNPDMLLYHNKVASIFYDIKKHDSSIATIKKAFKKWPKEKNLYLDLISIYFDYGLIDSAFVYTDKVMAMNVNKNNLIELYSNMAQFLITNEEFDLGGKVILKAYEIDSNNAKSLNMLYHYYNYILKDEEKASGLRNKIFHSKMKTLNELNK